MILARVALAVREVDAVIPMEQGLVEVVQDRRGDRAIAIDDQAERIDRSCIQIERPIVDFVDVLEQRSIRDDRALRYVVE